MENRAKFRFPRALLSTLTSCKTQDLLSDVIHNHQNTNPLFSSSSSSFSSSDPLLPPPPSPFRRSSSSSSLCKPKRPETFDQMVRDTFTLAGERKKVSGGETLFSPVLPIRKQRKNKTTRRTRFSSSDEDWFSSDDEREDELDRETETLFSSSRSFLSLSSDPDSIGSARAHTRRRPPSALRREARRKQSSELKRAPLEEKVKGSFAVVKRSSDPYSDFRTSMVEMIMEKQIFGAKELHQLLQCFLSLNPTNHHRIIFEVFAEICDALFSDF